MTNPRVWSLGLDGATLALIRPWASSGHLPVLARLIDGGVSGNLRSTYPPLTGPAWSSFMTGKSPAWHGVLEFFRREEGTYRQRLNSPQDLDGHSLWRILSDAGRQVGVMGVPLTYPPEAVNGFLITGLLTSSG
ncbi:MAG: phosphodiesterase, partial [Anaerolineaceae bacterium]|nr:phosphodiesterase [Anaerolineaceae bacterium]